MTNNKPITKTDNGIKLAVKILPNTSKCEIVGIVENEIKIKLDVPPLEGRANEKCVKFLSKLLGVPKTFISIISGQKSRSKVIFIEGDANELENKIYELIN